MSLIPAIDLFQPAELNRQAVESFDSIIGSDLPARLDKATKERRAFPKITVVSWAPIRTTGARAGAWGARLALPGATVG